MDHINTDYTINTSLMLQLYSFKLESRILRKNIESLCGKTN